MIDSSPNRHAASRIAAAAALSAGLLMTSPVYAASSEWVETEGGRIRLSALSPAEDGSIRAVLDVDLLPGWKTYWRDPGEAGVPPSIETEGSDNISSATIHFPAPERIKDAYSIWAGYDYPVLFPITLKQDDPGAASVLEAKIFLGICETICIPFQTSFTLEIDPEKPANAFEKRLVTRAFNSLPEQSGDGFEVVGKTVGEDGTLSLSIATPDQDENGELFVTGPPGWRFDTPQIASHDGNIVTYHVSVNRTPDGETLDGQPIGITVKASGRAMETELVLP